MTDLNALIERLEKAPGPDRELDTLIEIAVDPDNAKLPWSAKAGHVAWLCGDQHWRDGRAAKFTSSIDAAMTLVPTDWRVNSGDFSVDGRFTWMLTLTSQPRTDWFARRRSMTDDTDDDPLYVSGRGNTLAIALCIAALSARTRTARGESGSEKM